MSDTAVNLAQRASIYMRFLSRLGYAKKSFEGLTRAQWSALVFFGNANRFSRTLTGFAGYHSATLGSASQTIDGLVKKGLIERIPDKIDRRRAYFDLTDKAQEVCRCAPAEEFAKAVSSLPKDQQQNMDALLQRILSDIFDRTDMRILGVCRNCKFFKERFDAEINERSIFCTKVGSDVFEADSNMVCVHYAPKSCPVDI